MTAITTDTPSASALAASALATPALAGRRLTIGYASSRRSTTTVARGLEVELGRGELVCLLGPNGAGKSTLLRTLAGLQPPLAGQITLNGRESAHIPARELARDLSVVLTERVSAGMLDVYSLVSLGRHPHTDWTGRLSARDHEVVRSALTLVGAERLATRLVAELSDGERQRVMVARALAQEPTVMVLDEITAFLDLPRRVDIMRLLRDLSRHQCSAILLSTHDLDLALRTADRIWLLGSDGRLLVGTPEELVLNGAFERTFESDGIVFDRQHGAFRLSTAPRGEVALSGHGEYAVWTARALDRVGFHVRRDDGHASSVMAHIAIVERDDGTEWELRSGDPGAPDPECHRSLGGLLGALERRHATTEPPARLTRDES